MTTLQAFDARAIVETKLGALRCRAILPPLMCLTEAGLLYVWKADDVQLPSAAMPYGAVLIDGAWIPLTDNSILMWARQEHLHWRKPDGSIVRWDVVPCPDCAATGKDWLTMAEMHGDDCARCNGTGMVIINE